MEVSIPKVFETALSALKGHTTNKENILNLHDSYLAFQIIQNTVNDDEDTYPASANLTGNTSVHGDCSLDLFTLRHLMSESSSYDGVLHERMRIQSQSMAAHMKKVIKTMKKFNRDTPLLNALGTVNQGVCEEDGEYNIENAEDDEDERSDDSRDGQSDGEIEIDEDVFTNPDYKLSPEEAAYEEKLEAVIQKVLAAEEIEDDYSAAEAAEDVAEDNEDGDELGGALDNEALEELYG